MMKEMGKRESISPKICFLRILYAEKIIFKTLSKIHRLQLFRPQES